MGPLLIAPYLPFRINLSLNVCAGAPDTVPGLTCLLASQSKKNQMSRFFNEAQFSMSRDLYHIIYLTTIQ